MSKRQVRYKLRVVLYNKCETVQETVLYVCDAFNIMKRHADFKRIKIQTQTLILTSN